MPIRPPLRHRFSPGFSLVELSVVIAIMSIVAVLGLESMAGFLSKTAYESTQDRLMAVDNALTKYRYTYGFLPCPADPSKAASQSEYGKEMRDSSTGDCTNSTVAANILYGDIPVRDLGLPLNFMKDGYNSRMRYVVTSGLTRGTTFSTTNEAIKIRTGKLEATCTNDCTEYTKRAAYVILSFGADKRGSPTMGCVPNSSYEAMIDSANCRMGAVTSLSVAVPTDVFYVNSRINAGTVPAMHYDDVARWKSKGDL